MSQTASRRPSSLLGLFALCCVLTLLAVPPTLGQGFGATPKASLELFADRTAYGPGDTLRLAGRVTIEDHWHVNSNTPSYDYLIPTELTLTLPDGFAAPELAYPPHVLQKFEFTTEPIAVYDGVVYIVAEAPMPEDLPLGPLKISGSLRFQACDDKQCLPPTQAEASLELAQGSGKAANAEIFAAAERAAKGEAEDDKSVAPTSGSTDDDGSGGSLWAILGLALLGGLILNAMPCVLPVLSLKAFGLVESASRGRSHVVIGSLATAAGILVSFTALAGIAVAMLSAGQAIGWGVQFQQPGFVTFLAVVVLLFALNLWGLFEIPLPEKLAQVSDSGPRDGLAGHFLTGLFATLMATPCSAPFLGTAVGFALVQPPLLIFLIFLAIGVGLAMPYLLLAIAPGAAKLVPRPGPWMLTFKGLMGFLLAGAALWLFYVLAAQITSERLVFTQAAILLLALSVWLASQSQPGSLGKKVGWLGTPIAAALAIFIAVGSPPPVTAGSHATGYHTWVAFDEIEAKSLAEDDSRFVFVDVTADWCLTCKTTERLVLETPEIAAAFAEHDVVPMKADWTNRDDKITAFLAQFGKAAVPFYVLYRPGGETHAFGELLTKQRLLDALAGQS